MHGRHRHLNICPLIIDPQQIRLAGHHNTRHLINETTQLIRAGAHRHPGYFHRRRHLLGDERLNLSGGATGQLAPIIHIHLIAIVAGRIMRSRDLYPTIEPPTTDQPRNQRCWGRSGQQKHLKAGARKNLRGGRGKHMGTITGIITNHHPGCRVIIMKIQPAKLIRTCSSKLFRHRIRFRQVTPFRGNDAVFP